MRNGALFSMAAAAVAFSAATATATVVIQDQGGGVTTYFGQTIPNGGNPYPLVTPAQRVDAMAASDTFLTAIPGMPQFESFETFAWSPDANSPVPASVFPGNGSGPVIDFGPAGTATIGTSNGTGTAGIVARQTTLSTGMPAVPELERGRYAAFGDQYLRANAADLMLTFSEPQRAFGFWGVDIGDFGGSLELLLLGGQKLSYDIMATSTLKEDSGSILFWGVTSEMPGMTFTGIRFINTNFDGSLRDDIFAFDRFVVSTEVMPPVVPPLPTTVGLGAVGLGGLAFGMRRRPM